MELTSEISKHNFKAFLWHLAFLSFAQNFIDIDTIIPAMLIDAGGNSIHIGIMTAIMLGGSSMTQLLFAPLISSKPFKKGLLIFGIEFRIVSLLLLGSMLYFSNAMPGNYIIILIFILITMFSVGGAFANISYTDIFGKSLLKSSRKPFFSIKQVVSGIIVFASALLAKQVLTSTSYPLNYAYMLFIGFVSLSIAAFGFFKLKEVEPSELHIQNFKHFFKLIKSELKENKRLKYFLGFINTAGVSIAFLPFALLYAKTEMSSNGSSTGSYLLYKVIGVVLTGLILYLIAGKFRYKHITYLNFALALLLPLLIINPWGSPIVSMVFVIGGIVFAIYNVSLSGILLEVSGTSNRALYTGIAGAGNLLPALFPIISGAIISNWGFTPFLILFISIIISSTFFIYKLDCKK